MWRVCDPRQYFFEVLNKHNIVSLPTCRAGELCSRCEGTLLTVYILYADRELFLLLQLSLTFSLSSVGALALFLSLLLSRPQSPHLPSVAEGPPWPPKFPHLGHRGILGGCTELHVPSPPVNDENQCPRRHLQLREKNPWVGARFGCTASSWALRGEDRCTMLNKSQSPSYPCLPAKLAPVPDSTVEWGHFGSLEKSLTDPPSIKTYGRNNRKITLPPLCCYTTISLGQSCCVSLNAKKWQWIETC